MTSIRHEDGPDGIGGRFLARFERRGGTLWLGFASFLESTVVPMPLEILVVPLMARRSGRALRIALAIWLGSLLGAASFYLLARAGFDPVVLPALEMLGLERQFDEVRQSLDGASSFWAIFALSVSPAPFQLATLGAGALRLDPLTFLGAVGASRFLRYFGLALLARWFGPRILRLVPAHIRKRFILLGIAVLGGGYLLWRSIV